jgi:hypothetical protein
MPVYNPSKLQFTSLFPTIRDSWHFKTYTFNSNYVKFISPLPRTIKSKTKNAKQQIFCSNSGTYFASLSKFSLFRLPQPRSSAFFLS